MPSDTIAAPLPPRGVESGAAGLFVPDKRLVPPTQGAWRGHISPSARVSLRPSLNWVLPHSQHAAYLEVPLAYQARSYRFF